MYNHPCFDEKTSHTHGRVHLPVARDCNIQCNFCNRKYDCVNENRPGVTSAVVSPEEALNYLERVMVKRPDISVVGIAGPGEAFAAPEITLRTLRLVRERFPQVCLCVATNGLNVLVHINELKKINVSNITVTVNAVALEIAEKIYSWVRYQKKIYRGIEAAKILTYLQIESIRELKRLGFVVKVNTIIIPGINNTHIVEIARKMSGLNVDILNCIPLCPSAGTLFADIDEPGAEMVEQIRSQAGQYIKSMRHCRRCRADATGLLGEELNPANFAWLKECRGLSPGGEERPYIAIGTREGQLINQHLGDAEEFWIYKKTPAGFKFLERRIAPERGSGVKRWIELGNRLSDCQAVLVSNVGATPREILSLKGIRVVETEGIIDDVLQNIAGGTGWEALEKKAGCDFGCAGAGRGCGIPAP